VLSLVTVLIAGSGLFLAIISGFLLYVLIRYTPIIGRIFEEKPVFLPVRVEPEPGGDDVRFTTSDGLSLAGTYYAARTAQRAGVMVFCHEYLSDRWSFRTYCDDLRDQGFDVFTFDFRNHGESGADPHYRPLQWVTDYEVRDARAALDYLATREDHDPAGVGLLGISRPRHHVDLYASLGRNLRGQQPYLPTHSELVLWLHRPYGGLVGPHPVSVAAPMPVPRRRASSCPALAPAVAHDPR
jgi:hypothetical protein